MFFFKKQEVWHLDLKSYLKKTLFEGDLEQEVKLEKFTDKHLKKVSDKIEKELNNLIESMRQNCEKLDEHLVYLAGGAILLTSQVIFQIESINLFMKILLGLAFTYAGVCICSIMMSYIFNAEKINRESSAKRSIGIFSRKLFQMSLRVNAFNFKNEFKKFVLEDQKNMGDIQMDEAFLKLNSSWIEVSANSRLYEIFLNLTNLSNLLAYVAFVVSIFLYLVLGVNLIQIDLSSVSP